MTSWRIINRPALFLKVSSLLSLFFYLFFDLLFLPSNIYAQTVNAVSQSSIPAQFGSVDETHTGVSGKTIYYIQDAHDSLEAQENIAQLIDHLISKEGIQTVFEEGYEGRVPTDDYFGFIEDPEIKEKTAYFFMDQLRLGGAEYAHIIRSEEFNLIGADSITLHRQNIHWYRKSFQSQQITQRDLDEIYGEVNRLAQKHLSKEMKHWLKLKVRFEEKQLGLVDYLKRIFGLTQLADAQYTELLSKYPNLQIILKADRFHGEEMYKEIESIEAKSVFYELTALEEDVAALHIEEDRDKQIFHYLKVLHLLKRLNHIQVTPVEFQSAKDILKTLTTEGLADFIARYTNRTFVLSKVWEETLESALNFYETAGKRDESIADYLDSFLEGDEESAILVFGGFHKSNIKKILKDRGLSYVILSPKISEISKRHQEYYKKLMAGEKHSYEVPHNLPQSSRVEPLLLLANAQSLVNRVSTVIAANPDLDTQLLVREISSIDLAAAARSEVRTKAQDQSYRLHRRFNEDENALIQEALSDIKRVTDLSHEDIQKFAKTFIGFDGGMLGEGRGLRKFSDAKRKNTYFRLMALTVIMSLLAVLVLGSAIHYVHNWIYPDQIFLNNIFAFAFIAIVPLSASIPFYNRFMQEALPFPIDENIVYLIALTQGLIERDIFDQLRLSGHVKLLKDEFLSALDQAGYAPYDGERVLKKEGLWTDFFNPGFKIIRDKKKTKDSHKKEFHDAGNRLTEAAVKHWLRKKDFPTDGRNYFGETQGRQRRWYPMHQALHDAFFTKLSWDEREQFALLMQDQLNSGVDLFGKIEDGKILFQEIDGIHNLIQDYHKGNRIENLDAFVEKLIHLSEMFAQLGQYQRGYPLLHGLVTYKLEEVKGLPEFFKDIGLEHVDWRDLLNERQKDSSDPRSESDAQGPETGAGSGTPSVDPKSYRLPAPVIHFGLAGSLGLAAATRSELRSDQTGLYDTPPSKRTASRAEVRGEAFMGKRWVSNGLMALTLAGSAALGCALGGCSIIQRPNVPSQQAAKKLSIEKGLAAEQVWTEYEDRDEYSRLLKMSKDPSIDKKVTNKILLKAARQVSPELERLFKEWFAVRKLHFSQYRKEKSKEESAAIEDQSRERMKEILVKMNRFFEPYGFFLSLYHKFSFEIMRNDISGTIIHQPFWDDDDQKFYFKLSEGPYKPKDKNKTETVFQKFKSELFSGKSAAITFAPKWEGFRPTENFVFETDQGDRFIASLDITKPKEAWPLEDFKKTASKIMQWSPYFSFTLELRDSESSDNFSVQLFLESDKAKPLLEVEKAAIFRRFLGSQTMQLINSQFSIYADRYRERDSYVLGKNKPLTLELTRRFIQALENDEGQWEDFFSRLTIVRLAKHRIMERLGSDLEKRRHWRYLYPHVRGDLSLAELPKIKNPTKRQIKDHVLKALRQKYLEMQSENSKSRSEVRAGDEELWKELDHLEDMMESIENLYANRIGERQYSSKDFINRGSMLAIVEIEMQLEVMADVLKSVEDRKPKSSGQILFEDQLRNVREKYSKIKRDLGSYRRSHRAFRFSILY